MRNEKYQETPIMEKDILSEENIYEPEQQRTQTVRTLKIRSFPNLKDILTILKYFKKPKLIVIIIFLISIIVTLLGLLLIATSKPNEIDKTRVKISVASPQASKDPDLEKSKKEVFIFNSDLESLDSELDNIKFPKIDLDINFD